MAQLGDKEVWRLQKVGGRRFRTIDLDSTPSDSRIDLVSMMNGVAQN
jgi:hypothetical protein